MMGFLPQGWEFYWGGEIGAFVGLGVPPAHHAFYAAVSEHAGLSLLNVPVYNHPFFATVFR